jgi:hypothetical protein
MSDEQPQQPVPAFADGAHVALRSRPQLTGVVVGEPRTIGNNPLVFYSVQPDNGDVPLLVAEAGLTLVASASTPAAHPAPAQPTPAELEAEAAKLLAEAQSETEQPH